MKQGALIFDETADRYDIRFDLADYYGGLHCGECMEVFAGGKWKPTRIEYGENWYLVGVRAEDLNGLRVRIYAGRREERTPCFYAAKRRTTLKIIERRTVNAR